MTATLAAPARSLIDELLEPIDTPYTDQVALARALKQMKFFNSLDADPTRARMVAQFALSSFWNYLALVAWTEDEKAESMTFKPFAPLQYLHDIALFVDERTDTGDFAHETCLFPKSRQLMISWLATHWTLYLCFRRRSTRVLFISATEDHGKELLKRCQQAYRLLAPWFKKAVGEERAADRLFTGEYVQFSNRSSIKVLPERGGDAARSYSATCVIMDEAGSQQSFWKSWTSVQGGAQSARGRTCTWAISTAKTTSYGFQELVEDVKDGVRGGTLREWLASFGLHITRNKNNGVDVVRVHYTADPTKRTTDWRSSAMAGFRSHAEWQQEMEIDFNALSGKALFPQLDPTVHLMRSTPRIERNGRRWEILVPNTVLGEPYRSGAVLGLGVDHGRRNPCGAILAACDRENDIFALWDYSVTERSATENAWAIKKSIDGLCDGGVYDNVAYQAIDAMHALADRRVGRIEDLYRYEWIANAGHGDPVKSTPIMPRLVACKKGAGSVQEGIDAISDMLHATLAIRAPEHPYWDMHGYGREAIKAFQKRRALFIAPGCTALYDELKLGRYQDKADETVNQPEGERDAHNHVRKALTYLMNEGFAYRE